MWHAELESTALQNLTTSSSSIGPAPVSQLVSWAQIIVAHKNEKSSSHKFKTNKGTITKLMNPSPQYKKKFCRILPWRPGISSCKSKVSLPRILTGIKTARRGSELSVSFEVPKTQACWMNSSLPTRTSERTWAQSTALARLTRNAAWTFTIRRWKPNVLTLRTSG